MGLFKDLFSKTANKLANEVIDNVKNYAGDKINGNVSSASTSATHHNLSVNERIEKVVREYYPDYELKKNVSSDIFDSGKHSIKYSYVLSRFDSIRLTIMVLTDKNEYRRADVVQAHSISENSGVHCINIMKYLPSTEEYINQRIAENIK